MKLNFDLYRYCISYFLLVMCWYAIYFSVNLFVFLFIFSYFVCMLSLVDSTRRQRIFELAGLDRRRDDHRKIRVAT